jgi:hypothetical protein
MLIKSWNIQKIGIWFLLTTFVVAAIILPAAGPPAVLAEIFALIVSLEIIFALSNTAPQRVCAGYHFGIRPRSPPAF